MADSGDDDATGLGADARRSHPAKAAAPADLLWRGSRPENIAWTVLTVGAAGVFTGAAFATGTVVTAIIVPVLAIPAAAIAIRLLWRTQLRLSGDGTTLYVQNLVRSYQIPVGQILHLRPGQSGISITMVDGRRFIAAAVHTSSPRRDSLPGHVDDVVDTIARAVASARASRPEIEAEIEASQPLRNRRGIRASIQLTIIAPVILTASFLLPASAHQDGRLRILGLACLPISLYGAYSAYTFARRK